VAKVMVHAADRGAAIDRLRRALDETEIAGIQTTLPFHRFVTRDPTFIGGKLSTSWVGERWDGPAALAEVTRMARLVAGLDALESGMAITVAGAFAGSSTAPDAASGFQAGPPDRPSDGLWARSGRRAVTDRWPG
jgi:hypothetical protein